MKIIKDDIPTLKHKRRVLVELDHGEQLLSVQAGRHYRLGEPMGDIVQGWMLLSNVPVTWSSGDQEWVADGGDA